MRIYLQGMFNMPFYLTLFQIPIAAQAILWNSPRQTRHETFGLENSKSEPTAAPLGDLELFKRQNAPGTSVCGYVTGDLSHPITCATGYCGFQSSLNAIACCNSYYTSTGVVTLTDCGFRTQCYDSTAMSQCTGACLSNSYALKCTSSASPLCFQYTFTDISSTIFACSTAKTLISANRFGDASKTTATSSSPPASDSSKLKPTSSSNIPPTSSGGSKYWMTTNFPPPSSSPVKTGPVTASPASNTPPSTSASGGASSHIGAIVAGVIGAAALILVVIGILLYFCLRKRM